MNDRHLLDPVPADAPVVSSHIGERQIAARARAIFESDYDTMITRVDVLFGRLLVFQVVAAIVVAFVVSPRAWSGESSVTHPHIWAAVVLGAIISALPCYLAYAWPGQVITRHVIGIAQMLIGALLIHLTGGRLETHFHVFGSLAFLAFYRDWRVLVSASIVVAIDHCIRGIWWPQSVFGVLTSSNWRWIEHGAWVAFIDVFLIASCRRGIKEMKDAARRLAELEATNALIEAKVIERTAELARHKDHLEDLVVERTAELQTTLDEMSVINLKLEQASQHKSQFLSTMSHELRTPLNAIIGFTELVHSEDFGPLNELQKDYIKRVQTSGNHLLSLITSLLDVAKIDAGAMGLSSETFDTEEGVESVVSLFRAQLDRKNLRVEVNVAEDARMVHADAKKFHQVLASLMSNAIHHSPENARITVAAESHSAQEVLFSVADEGPGIPASELERIFEEFVQLDRKRDEAHGGIGLGLSLARRIIELHGGQIHVDSTEGQGATFYFTMPRRCTAQQHHDMPAVRRHVVLVADSNEATLRNLKNLLALKNYDIVTTINGGACVEEAQRVKPDMILVAARMEGMDGLEVARAIRAMEGFAQVPIVAMASASSSLTDRDYASAGCSAFLSVPIKIRPFFALLDSLLKCESGAKSA